MKKFLLNIFLWVYIKVHTIFINLSFAMKDESLSNFDVDEKKKFNKRMIRSQLLQKFEQGQRDEKYVQDYYELLKKSDKFMRNATSHKKAVAADRWSLDYKKKDEKGKRLDHIGFFDGKHRHAGKTMGEVLEAELAERRTNDDDLELLHIFNNEPIEVGLSKIDGMVDDEFKLTDLQNKSKTFEFPLTVERENEDCKNKIEQLTQFLHVKKIGFEHRQLEFFIPKKYRTKDFDIGTAIFKEIIDIKSVYLYDTYGEMIGFKVYSFDKRLDHEEFEVLKFSGIQMEIIRK